MQFILGKQACPNEPNNKYALDFIHNSWSFDLFVYLFVLLMMKGVNILKCTHTENKILHLASRFVTLLTISVHVIWQLLPSVGIIKPQIIKAHAGCYRTSGISVNGAPHFDRLLQLMEPLLLEALPEDSVPGLARQSCPWTMKQF